MVVPSHSAQPIRHAACPFVKQELLGPHLISGSEVIGRKIKDPVATLPCLGEERRQGVIAGLRAFSQDCVPQVGSGTLEPLRGAGFREPNHMLQDESRVADR